MAARASPAADCQVIDMVEWLIHMMHAHSSFTVVLDAFTKATSLVPFPVGSLSSHAAAVEFRSAWSSHQQWARWFLRNYSNAQTQNCIACPESTNKACSDNSASEAVQEEKVDGQAIVRPADAPIVNQLIAASPIAQRNAVLAELYRRVDDEQMLLMRQLATYPSQAGRLLLFRCDCLRTLHSHCYQSECAASSAPLRRCSVCKTPTQLTETQLVVAQSLLTGGKGGAAGAAEPPQFESDRAFHSTARFTALLEHIKEKPKTDKIVVFSKYPRALRIAQLLLTNRDIRSVLVEADGPEVVQFRRSVIDRVLLMPLLSGNYGLNLQVANHVIFLEPPERWDANKQAIGRVHRFGQLNQVVITHLVAADTHEEQHYLHATTPPNKQELAIDVRIRPQLCSAQLSPAQPSSQHRTVTSEQLEERIISLCYSFAAH